jgi:hypothetical protein
MLRLFDEGWVDVNPGAACAAALTQANEHFAAPTAHVKHAVIGCQWDEAQQLVSFLRANRAEEGMVGMGYRAEALPVNHV